MTDLVERLRAASHDERLSTGMLYREAADEIERLRAEVEQQRLELGITGDACGALDSEVKQLRARVAELEADADRWYRRAVALGHPTWYDADRAAAMKGDGR